MRSTPLVLAACTATHVLAQNTNPPCINDCTSRLPINSHCDGDETGTALDVCTCDTWMVGAGSPLVACIKACPTVDQSVFVAKIPELCRSRVFPGVTASSPTASTGTPSSTGASQGSPTTNGAPSSTTSPNAGIEIKAPGIFAVGGLVFALLF